MKSLTELQLASPRILGWIVGRNTLIALLVFAVISVVSPAAAREQFALVGTWQHTDGNGVATVSFYPDGTFQSQIAVPPGPNGSGSGIIQWRGIYRPTGESSWTAITQAFRFCASGGGCTSCPASPGDLPAPPNYGCEMARSMLGYGVGEETTWSWELQGGNLAVDQYSKTWRRTR